MSYDIKFRRHVLKVRAFEGLRFAEVSKCFGVSNQTVYNWSKRIEEKKPRHRPPAKIDLKALACDVELYPDAYIHERAKRFGVSIYCLWKWLQRLGVTYKKKSSASQGGSREKVYILPKDRES